MQRWRYVSMLPRAIIRVLLHHQQRRRRRRWWRPALPHNFPLILMIIGSAIWFDVCQALPSPGLLNMPPSMASVGGITGPAAGGNGAVANGNDVRSDTSIGNGGDLLEDLQKSGHIFNLTRQHDGDVFRAHRMSNCNADTCVGLSSGTAGLFTTGNDKPDKLNSRSGQHHHHDMSVAAKSKNPVVGSCDCRCLPYLSTYREDLGICVDDIHECTLSPFVSGSSAEKIPFVFLPLRGQIIYPSREISFPDIRTPVCAVTGAQYLTSNGWTDLRNPIDADYPFRMFRDEGRTFLQWLGESDLRKKMQGRLIVVHLVCRDMMFTLNATEAIPIPPKNVFSPCVAFRVNGTPVKYFYNVSEVLFQAETTSVLASTSDGMSTKEYIVIGVCSLLLGLIYVSSVLLYLHVKKRKNQAQGPLRNSLNDLDNEINYPKNDQVTFGTPFNRSGSVYSVTSLATTINDGKRSRNSIGSNVGGVNLNEEMGIIKNNPLLQHFPILSDHHSGFTSDISNSNSECEMDVGGFHDKMKQLHTSALVHPVNGGSGSGSSSNGSCKLGGDQPPDSTDLAAQDNECLPEENVSIVEDMTNEEKLENMRAIVNGTVRKKLYFNPAYFEPHLLVSPPPAAIEFLTKIREVIAIAKYKMSTKRYQPSLVIIPEESTLTNHESALYGSQMQIKQTQSTDCNRCASNRCSGHVKNCGDKRNIIEKWLQSVPHTDAPSDNNKKNTRDVKEAPQCSIKALESGSGCYRSRKSPPAGPPRKDMSAPKQRPPPPPVSVATAPKIISHSLKPSVGYQSNKNTSQSPESPSSSTPTTASSSSKTTISVKHKYDSASLSSITNVNSIYAFADPGIELYNNPKFNHHDSPSPSQRSRASSHRSKSSSRKRLDVLDQYAAAVTPASLTPSDRQHYEMLRNMKQIPNMVYEAIAKDYNSLILKGNHRSNGFTLDIPTPDYDSTIEKNIKDIYNNTQSSVPSVPTPDYSTLSKKSLRHCQPDSPVYRRKSPQYLIVDYETDSLERLTNSKRKSSHSSSSPSSDVSSQLSPSLSTALPLEEEVEIRHTIYDKMDGFRKDGDSNIKKKVSSTSSSAIFDNNSSQKEVAARIKYDTPFRGSMTIEVEHEPQSDLELSTDSDQFEPDTLDRKPKKHSFCDANAWSEHLKKSQHFVNAMDDSQEQVSYGSLDNMTSLPDLNNVNLSTMPVQGSQQFVLRSSNSFRSKVDSPSSSEIMEHESSTSKAAALLESKPSFGSLREIYQSKVLRQNGQRPKLTNSSFTEQGRLLTLEAKHSRRQRVTLLQVEPPDVLQPDLRGIETKNATASEQTTSGMCSISLSDSSSSTCTYNPSSNLYDAKNSKGWNTNKNSVSNSCRAQRNKRTDRCSPPPPPVAHIVASTGVTEEETTSNHSESTDITGVSDTQVNSEFEDSCHIMPGMATSNYREGSDSCRNIMKSCKKNSPNMVMKHHHLHHHKHELENDFNAITHASRLNGLRNDYSLNKYLNRRKSIEMEDDTDSIQDTLNNNKISSNTNSSKGHQLIEDPNKIDVLSISSRSNRSSSRLSERTKEMYRNARVPVGIAYPQRSSSSSTAVNASPSNIQTVYRCEVAPMPLTNGMQIAMGLKDRAKKSKDLKNAWRKFVSMATSRFSPTASPPPPPFDKKPSVFIDSLYGSGRQEMDSGYMSGDSSEVYHRRFYDRYNFKLMTGKDHIIRVDTIEDNSDGGGGGEDDGKSAGDADSRQGSTSRSFQETLDSNRIADQEAAAAVARTSGTNRISDNGDEDNDDDDEDDDNDDNDDDDDDDNDSDRTLTRSSERNINHKSVPPSTVYSSEDEHCNSPSFGSSETDDGDDDTNTDDMCESGAESIETHSVLYKSIRKS